MFVLLVMIHFLFYFYFILPILWVIMLLAGVTAQGRPALHLHASMRTQWTYAADTGTQPII